MLIPGRNPTIEALRSGHVIQKIYLQKDMNVDEKIAEIKEMAQRRKINIQEISREELTKLVEDHHQGVIAAASFQVPTLTEEVLLSRPGKYIYFREAQYEHNVGAIVRTAEAAGITGVVIPPKQEITSTIARISMGAIFHIPIYQYSLFPALKLFHDQAYKITGMEMEGSISVYEADLTGNQLFIVGGEDRSLSSQVIEHCDQLISIPQYGKINSLNMSVAAGIVMYEAVRQENV